MEWNQVDLEGSVFPAQLECQTKPTTMCLPAMTLWRIFKGWTFIPRDFPHYYFQPHRTFCFILFLRNILEASLLLDTLTVLAIMVPFFPILWVNVESVLFRTSNYCRAVGSVFFFLPLHITGQKSWLGKIFNFICYHWNNKLWNINSMFNIILYIEEQNLLLL